MNIEQIPKPNNVDADLVSVKGKLPFSVSRAPSSVAEESTGVVMTACWQRSPEATREILAHEAVCEDEPQLATREGRRRVREQVGEARSTERSRVMLVEGRGLGLVTRQEEEKTGRLA